MNRSHLLHTIPLNQIHFLYTVIKSFELLLHANSDGIELPILVCQLHILARECLAECSPLMLNSGGARCFGSTCRFQFCSLNSAPLFNLGEFISNSLSFKALSFNFRFVSFMLVNMSAAFTLELDTALPNFADLILLFPHSHFKFFYLQFEFVSYVMQLYNFTAQLFSS